MLKEEGFYQKGPVCEYCGGQHLTSRHENQKNFKNQIVICDFCTGNHKTATCPDFKIDKPVKRK